MPIRVYNVGLFDWKNNFLNPPEIAEVFKCFVPESTTSSERNGWFTARRGDPGFGPPWLPPSFEEVGVTHSRFIVVQTYDEKIQTFEHLRPIRKALNDLDLKPYLAASLGKLSETGVAGRCFSKVLPDPFAYVYQLIVLDETDKLYLDYFKGGWKNANAQNNGGRVNATVDPFDLRTTCFFLSVPDPDAGILIRPRSRVAMRVSGASLLMGPTSRGFLLRLINTLYDSGLYRSIRVKQDGKTDIGPSESKVHYGLEFLLESQGEEVLREFSQHANQEAMFLQNTLLLILTAIIGVLSVVVGWFALVQHP